jgi:hypothetical protein
MWNDQGQMIGVRVEDESIFEQLANGTKDRKYADTKSGIIREAKTGVESIDDMVSVFKFAADNTDTEWSIESGNVDGEMKIGLSTSGRSQSTRRALGYYEPKAAIHSHPASEVEPGERGEKWSMGTDANRSNNRQYGQYIYMPGSGNLWQVKGGSILSSPYIGTNEYMKKLLR